LREVRWEDHAGRYWLVELPDNVPDTDAEYGIILYPVDLSSLGLPIEIEVRLHNQLYHRGIRSGPEARLRQSDISTAIRTALRVDALRIIKLYEDEESLAPILDA